MAASLIGAGLTAGAAALLFARSSGRGPWKPQEQQEQDSPQQQGQQGGEEQQGEQDEPDQEQPQMQEDAEAQDSAEGGEDQSDQAEQDEGDQGGPDEGMLDRARHTYESVKGRVAETVGNKARQGKEKIGNLWHDHPLAVGAGILAVGVAAGMMLPISKAEKSLVSGVSGRFADRVKNTGKELLEQGKEMASNVFKETGEALGEEMEREGLTPDKLSKKVKRIAGRIKDVVSDAVEGD